MSLSDTNYYEKNAHGFFQQSLAIDMSALYEPFLVRIPTGANILDAGCGSGRDAKAFLARGYKVTAFDAAPALAAVAERYLQQSVDVLRFQDLVYEAEFNGIWACASLLHVSKAELPSVLRQLTRALKPDGIIYASFKYGGRVRKKDGRTFTDLNEKSLATLLEAAGDLYELETWVSQDQRPDRMGERWLNTVLSPEPKYGT